MFGKFLNNYYYGKSGKGDFQKDDLPSNRFQLFFEMLKIRFSGLFKLNIMYVIVWLPAMVLLLNASFSWFGGLITLSENNSTFNFLEFTQSLILRTLILLIPCIAITGPFTAGLSFVVRNWARDEHAFVWSDYKDAIKSNWKQGLIFSSLTSVIPLISFVGILYYSTMAKSNYIFYIPLVLMGAVAIIWSCMTIFFYPQMVTYSLNIKNLIKNCLLLSLARLPHIIGIRLLSLLPIIICILVSFFTTYFQIALIITFFYYILFGFAFNRFIYASFTNAVFDELLNSKIEGAEINRGLSKQENDEFNDSDDDLE